MLCVTFNQPFTSNILVDISPLMKVGLESLPIYNLLFPVSLWPAWYPIAILPSPLTLLSKASLPRATFLFPIVLAVPASNPKNILSFPVVKEFPADLPKDELLPPVSVLFPALSPANILVEFPPKWNTNCDPVYIAAFCPNLICPLAVKLVAITFLLELMFPEAVIWPVDIKFEALTDPDTLISLLADIDPTIKLSVITASSLE